MDSCMGRLCLFLVVREPPFGGGTLVYVMALEAPQHPLPRGTTHMVVTMIICHQPPFPFLFFFSFSFHLNFVLTIKKIRFALLFYNISGLTLNILISNFDS